MGSIIRSTDTVFYSLLYLNSRQGFNRLKYLSPVISVKMERLPDNNKNRLFTHSWTARVRLIHSWADNYTEYDIARLSKQKSEANHPLNSPDRLHSPVLNQNISPACFHPPIFTHRFSPACFNPIIFTHLFSPTNFHPPVFTDQVGQNSHGVFAYGCVYGIAPFLETYHAWTRI